MPSSITIDESQVTKLLQSLNDFSEVGVKRPMTKGATAIKERLVSNIESGKSINDASYPHIKDPQTHLMEIAFSGPFTDTRKRIDVTGNPVAMNVTGETAESIDVQIKSNSEVNVGYDNARTDVVLKSNAKNRGNVSKPVRDPVGLNVGIPTDFEFDAVANAVEAALDGVLGGF